MAELNWFDSLSAPSGPTNGGIQVPGMNIPIQTQAAPTGTPTPATPPAQTPAPATPTAGSQITMQQFNDAWLSSPYPGTVDGLKQFYAAHPEYAQAGITLGGSKGDKVYGPGGAYWGDAVIGAGAGGQGKSGLSGDTGGGGGGSTLGSLGYSFGSSMAAWTKEFQAPTAQDALNSPGFQFALGEGLKGIQNSAAARGTLLSGGTLKGLENYAIGTSLQNYGDVYNRSMGEYLLGRDNFYQNQDRPFNKNLSLASLGKPT